MRKVLVADDMHPSISELLQSKGYACDYCPTIQRSEIISILAGYHGLIIRSKTSVDDELLVNAKRLRFVARAGAGVDKMDEKVLISKNIALLNAPEGNRDALGEHAVGMLLALMNKISTADLEIRDGIWQRSENRGHEIKGKTVGIFGFGFMGSAFAQKLSGFECEIIAYDKYKSDYVPDFVEEVDFETLKRETEILSVHVPLTHETNRLFDLEMLSQFPRLKYLLNTARGEVVVLRDILGMLEARKLQGCALDVLENEKLNQLTEAQNKTYQQLFLRQDVLFTPHVGGWTFESYKRINEVLVDKISKLDT
jgi:D-3-phosphoglycerate dehydrogenase